MGKFLNLDENENNVYKKPPLGVMPKMISIEMYRSNRIDDILAAMERYSNDNEVIPVEWIIELRELLSVTVFDDPKNASKWWEKYRNSDCDIK